MPLFFILSGYTFRIAENKETLIRHLKNNVKHLMLPCLYVTLIAIVASLLIYNTGDGNSVLNVIHRYSVALIWASGVRVYEYPAAGAIWFIISLFWAKFLMDVVSLAFPGKYIQYIFFFVGIAGICLGVSGLRLPQNFDVTFVAIFYVSIGMQWKKYQDLIEKYSELIFIFAITIWFSCLYFCIYIEMATRSYPFYLLSFIESICGTFAVCYLCKALAQNAYVKNAFIFIGVHSLLIFFCHHLDWIAFFFIPHSSYFVYIALRVFVVLSIAFVVYLVKYCLSTYYSKLKSFNAISTR